MDRTLNFTVSISSNPTGIAVKKKSDFPAPFVDAVDFKKIAEFCLEQKLSPCLERQGLNVNFFTVQCDEGHPSVQSLLQWLERLGWKPWPRIHTADTPDYGFFPLRVVRDFSKKDLAVESHLWLLRWGSISASLAPKLDERFEFCGFCANHMSGRWSHDFLEVSGLRTFAVSEVGKEILEAGSLKGLIFREVEWDQPKKAKRPFFLLDCEKTMPPCLLPVVEERCQAKSKWYLDGPYEPPILQFNQSRFNDIADVDAACHAIRRRCGAGMSRQRALLGASKEGDFSRAATRRKLRRQLNPMRRRWVAPIRLLSGSKWMANPLPSK